MVASLSSGLGAAEAMAANDFGDAPDGAKTGYTGGAATGHFPSKAATPGPRTTPGGLVLGGGAGTEANSKQVDKDDDDGVTTSLTACSGASTVSALVNASGLPAANRDDPGDIAYLNVWADWNRDGDWTDPTDGCRPEWAVQNMPIRVDTAGPLGAGGIGVVPIGLVAGMNVKDVWMRVTVTLKDPVDPTGGAIANPNGGARAVAYTHGEVEDYLVGPGKGGIGFGKKKKKRGGGGGGGGRKKFKVSCVPNPALIPHGGTAKIKFKIKNPGKGLIFGSTGPRKTADGELKFTPKKPQPKGVPKGFVVVTGFTFKSKKVDPPFRIQVVSRKFTFRRGKQVQKLTCRIVIVHFGNFNPFGIPRIICGNACAGLPLNLSTTSAVATSWRDKATIPTELVSLSLVSTAPIVLNGFQIPLNQNPPWGTVGSTVATGGDAPHPVSCQKGILRPEGGPASLNCSDPAGNALVDSFFDVSADAFPTGNLTGVVTIGGQDFLLDAPKLAAVNVVTGSVGGVNPNGTFQFQLDQMIRAFQLTAPAGHNTVGASGAVANPPATFNCLPVQPNSFRCRVTGPPLPPGVPVQGTFNDPALASGQTFQMTVRQPIAAEDQGPFNFNVP